MAIIIIIIIFAHRALLNGYNILRLKKNFYSAHNQLKHSMKNNIRSVCHMQLSGWIGAIGVHATNSAKFSNCKSLRFFLCVTFWEIMCITLHGLLKRARVSDEANKPETKRMIIAIQFLRCANRELQKVFPLQITENMNQKSIEYDLIGYKILIGNSLLRETLERILIICSS